MISIIIATHNYARYISEAIRSLQIQSYKDWECIVVDDGSTDNTKEVVSKLVTLDTRIKYLQIENSGPSLARNIGLESCKGDYVLFLDADDLLQDNKLMSHLEAFRKDPDLDVAYGDVRYFNDGDNDPGNFFFSLGHHKKQWIPAFSGYAKILESKVLRENIMVTSSPLFKKHAFIKIGLFDKVLKKLEDWELFQRMVLNNLKLKYIDSMNSWVLMRSHQTSYSFNKDDMRSYLLPILQKNLLFSKVSLRNRLYLLVRMIEEVTDLLLLNIAGKRIAIRSYVHSLNPLLFVLVVMFLPVFVTIKIFRLFR